MSPPLPSGVLGCMICASRLIRGVLTRVGDSSEANHLDVFCAVCDEFIVHFDVKLYEDEADESGEEG